MRRKCVAVASIVSAPEPFSKTGSDSQMSLQTVQRETQQPVGLAKERLHTLRRYFVEGPAHLGRWSSGDRRNVLVYRASPEETTGVTSWR